ncbi:MAG: hypothetical protein GF307_13555 [candidate division Zixibacteria bacterium]|nr:hypothetical protein [candidate division Zixibacteria bacterium]
MTTNVKFLIALVALLFMASVIGCSSGEQEAQKDRRTEIRKVEKPDISAESFVGLYNDLQRTDRKNAKIIESFLKRNDLEGQEYRLTTDSVFIFMNSELVENYRQMLDRYDHEKQEVFSKYDINIKQYEEMVLALATNSDPAWADSVNVLLSGDPALNE